MTTGIYHRADGTFLNYEKEERDSPGLVYLHGLMSSKDSKKGVFLKETAKRLGLSYLSFDFSGHGQSWGQPQDIQIGRCLRDAMEMIEQLTTGPQILLGSSMGGWIALLTAIRLSHRIAGVVGLAAGPDFTKWIWNDLLSEEYRDRLRNGEILGPSEETHGYCFTYDLFKDSEAYFLLDKPISYTGPVVLLNGDKDLFVPPKIAFQIKEQLVSQDVEVRIIKGAGHSLSAPSELERIENAILYLLKRKEK